MLDTASARHDARPLAWYAIYTRSRHEQAVERYLARSGLHAWTPLLATWSLRTDRRKLIEVPALPGYLFVRCNLTPDVRAAIKKAPGVVAIVGAAGPPSPVPDEQIESLRIVLASRQQVEVKPTYAVGQPVRLRSGPLEGATGVLTEVSEGKGRLHVRIDHVGLSVVVDVHVADVAPA